ncbi:Flp pilus assembly complex ATPase component TadA, partial [Candidatus Woesearchaeota archaeon]|nr:Flp pilus assembly complex ATPase component TadA [Candidatus Woesearchaeota archaeon]
MALFGESKKPFTYEVLREGEEVILMVDLEQYPHSPSLEDDSICMSRTVDILAEAGNVTKIVYTQKRNYEYDYNQTLLIQEIAHLYLQLAKRKEITGYGNMLSSPQCSRWAGKWYSSVQDITGDLMKRDPIGAFVELKRMARDERIRIDKSVDPNYQECSKKYISVLQYLMALMEKTKLIAMAKPYLSGYKIAERSVYRRIFSPDIRPDFMFTKLMANYPAEGEEIDSYFVDKDTEVTIFQLPDNVQYMYHLVPPEFKLSEEKYEIVDTARKIMAEHKPTRQEFIDPERMRQVFYNIGSDLIDELVNYRKLSFTSEEIDEMTKILVRYTVGFGLIEVLLQDEKVQDITINSPMGETPIFIVHQDYADCMTNIVPTMPESESWASKLRLISGRPLDEANPILDTELSIPGANARIAVVAPPLNPTGLAYAFRRHRDKPWTLPLFIKNKMMNPMAAGILSFMIDGSRSMLVAGTRSAGKTSLLGAMLVELMRKYRVITIEDSVTGDSNIFIQRNNKIEKTTIGALVDGLISKYGKWYNLTEHEATGNPENIKVFAMDKKGKIKLAAVSKFIRHKVKKPIYKITTRTGRTIKVTGDHSLFGLDSDAKVAEVKSNALNVGDHIAVPRFTPNNNKPIRRLQMLDELCKIPNVFFRGASIEELISKYKNEIKQLGKSSGYDKSTIRSWIKKGFLPGEIVSSLADSGIHAGNGVSFSYNNSLTKIPANIELSEEFLTFIGLWIADG